MRPLADAMFEQKKQEEEEEEEVALIDREKEVLKLIAEENTPKKLPIIFFNANTLLKITVKTSF